MRLTNSRFLWLSLSLAAFLLLLANPADASAQNGDGRSALETKQLDVKKCIDFRYPVERLVIKDAAAMKSLVRNDASREWCLEHLKDVDFGKQSLVGIELHTGWCRNPPLTYRVIKEAAKKKYLLSVLYELPKEPCRALDRYELWVLVPKLPAQYEVEFEVKAQSLKTNSF